jgi:hypothetical protein
MPELLAKHSAQDLGLQIVSTRNMLPLTNHNMVVRQAALEAINAENAYFDSAGERRRGLATHTSAAA